MYVWFRARSSVGTQKFLPVLFEQGQPLRAVEPDEWATKVRAKQIPDTYTMTAEYSRAHV